MIPESSQNRGSLYRTVKKQMEEKDRAKAKGKDFLDGIIFANGTRITHLFGQHPEWYEPFGLKGHEGIDLCPFDGSWDIISPIEGYLDKDIDNPRDGGAYGNFVTLVDPFRRIVIYFCHMEKNYKESGQWVRKGEPIGKMGNTGNSKGAHLHMSIYEYIFKNGNHYPRHRLNYHNGFKGMVDPLPYIQNWEEEKYQSYIKL